MPLYDKQQFVFVKSKAKYAFIKLFAHYLWWFIGKSTKAVWLIILKVLEIYLEKISCLVAQVIFFLFFFVFFKIIKFTLIVRCFIQLTLKNLNWDFFVNFGFPF